MDCDVMLALMILLLPIHFNYSLKFATDSYFTSLLATV